AIVVLNPGANQIIQPTGDIVPLTIRVYQSTQTANLMEIKNSTGSTLAYVDKTGLIDAKGYKKSGADLASTDLSDTANIIRLNSPSITTPTMSDPTFTGISVSTTPDNADNSTRVATTAFVINQGYAKADSPAFTGTPTAPTPTAGDNSTKIATTAFVKNAVDNAVPPSLPTGTILSYGGSTAPSGWLLCDGSEVSRTTYSALFNVIGETYGVGDGSTTFNLPDLRGRFAVGVGSHADVDALNDNDGVAVGSRRPAHSHSQSLSVGSVGHSHSFSINSDGAHSHTFQGGAGTTTAFAPGTQTRAAQSGRTTSSAGDHSHSISTSTDGHSHNLGGTIGLVGIADRPAYLVANYIIKT
ncbi:MAG: tail fiber protein, partial [Nitrososphaerales archaeon]